MHCKQKGTSSQVAFVNIKQCGLKILNLEKHCSSRLITLFFTWEHFWEIFRATLGNLEVDDLSWSNGQGGIFFF